MIQWSKIIEYVLVTIIISIVLLALLSPDWLIRSLEGDQTITKKFLDQSNKQKHDLIKKLDSLQRNCDTILVNMKIQDSVYKLKLESIKTTSNNLNYGIINILKKYDAERFTKSRNDAVIFFDSLSHAVERANTRKRVSN